MGLATAVLLVFNYSYINAQTAGDTLKIWVDGVCGMCKDRVEKAAVATKGVESADWNIEFRELTVIAKGEGLDADQLQKNIALAGHDTEAYWAPEDAYNALHGCCKYRDAEVIAAHQPTSEETEEPMLLNGVIVEPGADGTQIPLVGASVQWAGTETGTVTDKEGAFEISRSSESIQLVVSYVGYQPDTITIDQEGDVVIVMNDAVELDAVEVRHRKRSTTVSFIEPASIQYLSEKELLKAACCSLAESFETTPSVDVGFADAVTGTRKIQMLGLESPYLQITRENMPDVRGLSALHGMDYTAGAWIEGIHLNTGAGSVVNGFESFTGQINVELWKPETAIPAYLNLYTNAMGRLEGNLNLNHSLNEQWHTGLLLHSKYQQLESDNNNDGFLDNPLTTQLVGVNRWRFIGKNGWMGQAGIKGTYVSQEGGQVEDAETSWRSNHNVRRVEGWYKTGYVFPSRPYASVGLQLSGVYHDQESNYGLRDYNGNQQSFYSNLIYKSLIGDSQHTFKTGLSFQYDQTKELLVEEEYLREEWVPGAFFEYTYGQGEPLTVVAGLRGDYHNNFGFFVTPRLHLRYAFSEQLVWRASGGRGQRTASIFAENQGFLASSRSVVLQSTGSDTPYGLDAEVAWNGGTSMYWEFPVGERLASLNFSYFYTYFINQIIADYDQDPQSIYFYNLDGESYSNSLQVQADIELAERLDVRLAYRFNDVQVDYTIGQLQKPLISRHRAFVNTAYETDNGWKFDATANWQGARRIPSTASNPQEFQLNESSPSFVLVNGQISKAWGKQWEVYLGGENLLNYRQENPIISAEDPFSEYFDASLVWGPVFGRNLYLGMRYRFAGKDK